MIRCGIRGNVSGNSLIRGNVSDNSRISAKVDVNHAPAYKGEYIITPTTYEQILNTAGKIMAKDVIVERIPANYGLITWNGSFLKVS